MRPQRVWSFKRFGHKLVSILAILVSKMGIVLHSRLEFGMFLKETTVTSLSITQSNNALYNAVLAKTGLKQGIDLGLRS